MSNDKESTPGDMVQIHLLLTREMASALDDFMDAQEFKLTRTDVIRVALRRMLEAEAAARVPR